VAPAGIPRRRSLPLRDRRFSLFRGEQRIPLRLHSPDTSSDPEDELWLHVGAALIGLLLIVAFLRSVLQVAIVNRQRGDWLARFRAAASEI
jgi:hypothetical protein